MKYSKFEWVNKIAVENSFELVKIVSHTKQIMQSVTFHYGCAQLLSIITIDRTALKFIKYGNTAECLFLR